MLATFAAVMDQTDERWAPMHTTMSDFVDMQEGHGPHSPSSSLLAGIKDDNIFSPEHNTLHNAMQHDITSPHTPHPDASALDGESSYATVRSALTDAESSRLWGADSAYVAESPLGQKGDPDAEAAGYLNDNPLPEHGVASSTGDDTQIARSHKQATSDQSSTTAEHAYDHADEASSNVAC